MSVDVVLLLHVIYSRTIAPVANVFCWLYPTLNKIYLILSYLIIRKHSKQLPPRCLIYKLDALKTVNYNLLAVITSVQIIYSFVTTQDGWFSLCEIRYTRRLHFADQGRLNAAHFEWLQNIVYCAPYALYEPQMNVWYASIVQISIDIPMIAVRLLGYSSHMKMGMRR